MFSFLVTQNPVNKHWKKERIDKQSSFKACSNLSKNQSQAYQFSHQYYLSNFLDVQKQSFQTFLKTGLIQELKNQKIRVPFNKKNKKNKKNLGLEVIFYPEWYKLREPKLTVKQAIYARKTYSSDLYIPIKIVDEETKSFILDWFCLATIPLMTSNGHFIVNGLPRMIMSQIVRSPGIYFKKHFRSENLRSDYYTADFIAQRGTWLRFETDLKEGEIWVKMKNEQKMSFMHFFKFVGLASPILSRYYNYLLDLRFEPQEKAENSFLERAYVNRGYKEKIYTTLLQEKIQREFVRKNAKEEILHDPLGWMYPRLDEAMLLPGHEEVQKQAEHFFETFSTKISTSLSLQQQPFDLIPLITNTLDWDTQLTYELEQKYNIDEDDNPLFGMSKTHIEDLFVQLDLEYKLKYQNIYLEMFPDFGYKHMWKYINHIISSRLFDKRTYNLSLVGRAKLNQTLGLSIPLNYTLLTPYDFLFGALRLVQCATGTKPLSDIDNLMNRKIKPVGELIQNQFAVGLQRFEESFIDRVYKIGDEKKKPFFSLWQAFSQQVSTEALVTELKERFATYITEKPMNTAFKEFFNSNPLSQMLDQTNPLAEITHKRRLSSLGIGGVSRQNATMDIRGIHPTHYGRICPIETPEGQNAGLVNSFTIYSRVNQLGFIETPFYKLYRGFVVREQGPIFFLANHEKGFRIAPGDLASNSFGFLPQGILLPSRKTKLFERVDRSDLEYIGVHPLQMISIATSLIPFLEHDDGNRALMGSNMQRQSVPTIHPTSPIVGTGLESKVLADVDHILQAKTSGVVSYVDSQKICIYSSSLMKPIFKNEKSKAEITTNIMKQALNQKQQKSFKLQSDDSKPIILKKQPRFNSICINKKDSFLSFLSLTQFQRLYQSQRQNDRSGLMHIFEIMEKQKTYVLKHNTLDQFKNPFLLTLKHRATLDSSQVFLNAAFFALQSFSESISFSFNPCISYPQKKINVSISSKQKTSPFAKRIEFKMKKNKIAIPFSPKGKKATNQAAVKILSFLQNEFSCFFDPTQTRFQAPSDPKFFLRTRFPLQTFFLPRERTFFTPLSPQTLFNAILVNKFQNNILGRWRKKTSTIKPTFCQPGLIKASDNSFQPFIQKNSNPHFKTVHWKQPDLRKELFFQKFPVWLRPTIIQTEQIGYLPLNKIPKKSLVSSLHSDSQLPSLSQKMNFDLITYPLDKIARSNQDTYLLHRPVVKQGQWVEKGDILADNSSSCQGDLAIGKNLLVGYTPWEGYNFEDAVLLSDRVLSQELFTSLHVERYEVDIRDTPEGMEKIQANVPSLSDITHLDEKGIVKVGTWVKTGDILVGKQTPRDPESIAGHHALEGLVKAIFSDRTPAQKFKDTSLRVPRDVHGWVVHVEVVETIDDIEYLKTVKFVRKDIQKKIALEKKAKKAKLKRQKKRTTKIKNETQFSLKKNRFSNTKPRFKSFLKKRLHFSDFYSTTRQGFNFSFFDQKKSKKSRSEFLFDPLTKQTTRDLFNTINYSTVSFSDLCKFSSNKPAQIKQQVKNRLQAVPQNKAISFPELNKSKRIISKETVDFFANDLDNKLIKGALGVSKQDLFFKDIKPPQLPKRVNVYIAEKRVLQVGDKIAGRHGNKGIISNILPRQDMPYLPDGTPLDLVLNPLGVPSRMNVGQIFECLLGLAGSYLHQTYKIQPFDERYGCEASRSLVYSKLYEARVKTKQNWLFDPNFPGKVRLFDGRTGQCFEQPVTVGKAYILKLIHLVDEKIHARSTGPYSVVTQQPVRGRSKKGGQRVGEMEVWALEGFGAAYILQELLTVKSDDLLGGRERLVKKIVQNRAIKFGPPESFRVLLRELEALCVGAYVF